MRAIVMVDLPYDLSDNEELLITETNKTGTYSRDSKPIEVNPAFEKLTPEEIEVRNAALEVTKTALLTKGWNAEDWMDWVAFRQSLTQDRPDWIPWRYSDNQMQYHYKKQPEFLEECVIKFLQLEIEDKYLDSEPVKQSTGLNMLGAQAGLLPFSQADNPVMSVIGFLAGLTEPSVTAAAANRTVEALKQSLRDQLEKPKSEKGKEKEGDSMEIDVRQETTTTTTTTRATTSTITRTTTTAAQKTTTSSSGSETNNKITREQFDCIFGKLSEDVRDKRWEGYQEALSMVSFKPQNQNELIMFFAHVSHETNGLQTYEEYCGMSKECASSYQISWCGSATAEPGKHYYGRGWFQLSFPCNYNAAGQALGIDLLKNPEKAAESDAVAAAVGMWFWNDNNIGQPARQGNFGVTTQIINSLECGPTPQQTNRISRYQEVRLES